MTGPLNDGILRPMWVQRTQAIGLIQKGRNGEGCTLTAEQCWELLHAIGLDAETHAKHQSRVKELEHRAKMAAMPKLVPDENPKPT